MRACWTKVVDPYGPFDNAPIDFVPEILHLEGEILGTITKMWSTYFVIATDEQRYYFLFFNAFWMRSEVGWSLDLAVFIGGIELKSNAYNMITLRKRSGIGLRFWPRWPIVDGGQFWRYQWEKEWEPGTLTLKNLWVRKVSPWCKRISSKVRRRKDGVGSETR